MRLRTIVAAVVVLAVLGGVVAVAFEATTSGGGQLRVQWMSQTAVAVDGNHHGVAAGRIDGQPLVFVPRSGRHNTTDCALIALDGASGAPVWRRPVPPADCWIHAVATLRLADLDGDGTPEVLAPTTEDVVYALDPLNGSVELRHRLRAYGYSPAVVGHLTDGATRQLAVVDAKGTVFVIDPNGTTAWTRSGHSYVWATPAIADVTGGPGNELVVGFGNGWVTAYRGNGSVAWNASAGIDGSITWLTTGDANGDGKTDVVVATDAGQVALLNGPNGTVRWSRNFGAYAAVDAFGDGNGDGRPEVYAVAKDGKLRALDAATGRVEWTTTLTTASVQMTPPPVLGDVTGDGHPDLVVPTNDGVVSVVDPATGNVLATYQRKVPIWERVTLADTNGDGVDEIYVMYGDGRVVKLTYRSG